MGYVSGGPQVYTGRDMARSHKHLAISEEQWSSFMGVLAEVSGEFRLPADDMSDLINVISSMRADCVLAHGERMPRNPGHPAPPGRTLYARLGGVYPISLFCDRLVDALLSDRTANIRLDAKRTSASLKYLFTELVCSITGGPETMTAASLEETRLMLSSKELFQLIRCAEAASDHFRDGHLRTELMQLLYAQREHLLDPMKTEAADPHDFVNAVARISRDTHVPMVYVVGGGAVFFAGRDVHFGDATPAEQARCWQELQRLGFRKHRMIKVKSADDAAGGAGGKHSVHGQDSAFIKAEKQLYGDLRTLYGRVGGAFGLAKLADRLMDSWMKNDTLNANAKVAPWTENGQRQGFKFLVTQVVGYLTGGPQRYTGQPMEVAHKHLGITPRECECPKLEASTASLSPLSHCAPCSGHRGRLHARCGADHERAQHRWRNAGRPRRDLHELPKAGHRRARRESAK